MKLLIIATLLTACSEPPAPSEPDVTETTGPATTRPQAKAPEFVGVISSRVSRVIAAEFDGKVERLAIRNGQRVTRGQLLARLDDSELASRLLTAKGNLAAAKGRGARAGAAYASSSRALRSYQTLLANGVISAAELDSKRAELGGFGGDSASARGEAEAVRSQIAELEKQIASANVRAPIDGVVSIVKVSEGQIAQRGTAIARVFDPAQPVVRFAVPAKHKRLVGTGTRVELVLENAQVVPARVRSIEDEHDPSINYSVCEAVIDPANRVAFAVGDNGRVRLAAKSGSRR